MRQHRHQSTLAHHGFGNNGGQPPDAQPLQHGGNGDRAEAWYQLRYNCWGSNTQYEAGLRKRRLVEAQVLESLGVDYIDESEVLTPADYAHHIDKWTFTVPFVCGATNLGEALRRISEGACMIRSKGEAGTGDVSEAMKHIRTIHGEIRALAAKSEDEKYVPQPSGTVLRHLS